MSSKYSNAKTWNVKSEDTRQQVRAAREFNNKLLLNILQGELEEAISIGDELSQYRILREMKLIVA